MREEQSKTAFVTFYSFKGGVGRSMALINTAGILAGRGFRVLVIDLDLEAPGLSYLNPNSPNASRKKQKLKMRALQLGFVDLLSDAKERGQAADLFALSTKNLSRRYTQAYNLPKGLREFNGGSLHIMPAGKFDGQYARRFDDLNLRQLYQEGLGEPLIRALKIKLSEEDLYDYVLVDSRTGFSDEAGICTRDLADYLMILSGLNRQNVEGTCEFLKALRVATEGKKTFQIILSPVPNGEDKLLDERELEAKASFEKSWGAKVKVDLQIPYHPQLALTEEPHIFRRRRGYLFDAYRSIERSMLLEMGHDALSVKARIEGMILQMNFPAVLRGLRKLVRLDSGKEALTDLALDLGGEEFRYLRGKAKGDVTRERFAFSKILDDKDGRRSVKFIVENVPVGEREIAVTVLIDWLRDKSFDLAELLFKRSLDTSPNDLEMLGQYANFLGRELGNPDRAEVFYKRAIEINPYYANTLGDYGQLLVGLGRLVEGENLLLSAFKNLPPTSVGGYAEICFSLWLVSRMQAHNSDRWEQGFKFRIQQGIRRYKWDFNQMLSQAEKILSPEEFDYARALALAFLDENKVVELDQIERWRVLEPLDIRSTDEKKRKRKAQSSIS